MYIIKTTNGNFNIPKDTVLLKFEGNTDATALIQAKKVLRRVASTVKNDVALFLGDKTLATVKRRFVGRFNEYTTISCVREGWQHV